MVIELTEPQARAKMTQRSSSIHPGPEGQHSLVIFNTSLTHLLILVINSWVNVVSARFTNFAIIQMFNLHDLHCRTSVSEGTDLRVIGLNPS